MITKFKSLLLPIVFFSFISMSVFADISYKFVDLGLQESDRSEAVAVNDKGQVAGVFWLKGTKYYFLWNEKNGITLIDLPETAAIVTLNNCGQIAGNYKNDSGRDRGFVWDKRFGYLDIGTLGGNLTQVYDMNDYGHIVGQSECSSTSLVDSQREQHAFVWACGCMLDLGALNGDLGMTGDRSIATGINNKGQIVGISNYLIAHKGKFQRSQLRSFIWRDGNMEGIDLDIGPQFGSTAPSINNTGMAIFNNNKMGWFVVDLSTQEIIEMPFARRVDRTPKIADNGDLIFANDIVLIRTDANSDYSWNGNSYTYCYLSNSYENNNQWFPNTFRGKDSNNHSWFVGESTNIYNENHAVILVPLSK